MDTNVHLDKLREKYSNYKVKNGPAGLPLLNGRPSISWKKTMAALNRKGSGEITLYNTLEVKTLEVPTLEVVDIQILPNLVYYDTIRSRPPL